MQVLFAVFVNLKLVFCVSAHEDGKRIIVLFRSASTIEAVLTYETSVYLIETTRCYIPEGCNLCTRRRENLKSHTFAFNTLRIRSKHTLLKINYSMPVVLLCLWPTTHVSDSS
jgi:hypothetical protein